MTAPINQIPRVALLFEVTDAYARGILVGIGEFMLSHDPWSVYFVELDRNTRGARWLEAWNGEGEITLTIAAVDR